MRHDFSLFDRIVESFNVPYNFSHHFLFSNPKFLHTLTPKTRKRHCLSTDRKTSSTIYLPAYPTPARGFYPQSSTWVACSPCSSAWASVRHLQQLQLFLRPTTRKRWTGDRPLHKSITMPTSKQPYSGNVQRPILHHRTPRTVHHPRPTARPPEPTFLVTAPAHLVVVGGLRPKETVVPLPGSRLRTPSS